MDKIVMMGDRSPFSPEKQKVIEEQFELFPIPSGPNSLSKETQVNQFIDKFGASRDPEVYKTLIREEIAEVAEAAEHLLKEIADLIYVIEGGRVASGLTLVSLDPDDQANLAALWSNWVKHIPQWVIDEAFVRVHGSNMSKLGSDGKPIYRDDGKVLKGPNYFEPFLGDLV